MINRKGRLKGYNLTVKKIDLVPPNLELYEMEDVVKGFLEEPNGVTALEVVKLRKDIKKLQEKNKKLRKEKRDLKLIIKDLEKKNNELEEHYNRFDILDL